MAIKLRFKFLSSNPMTQVYDRLLNDISSRIKIGEEYIVYLVDKKKTRSNNLNRYYWKIVIGIISQETGIEKDDLHDLMKFMFNKKHKNIKTINAETGQEEKTTVEYGGSTTALNNNEFIAYYEKIREWSMMKLNCYVPAPNEVDDSLYLEMELNGY